jgi:hypothetical protein
MKSFATVTTPIVLPRPVRSGLEAAARALFDLGEQFSADFLRPADVAATNLKRKAAAITASGLTPLDFAIATMRRYAAKADAWSRSRTMKRRRQARGRKPPRPHAMLGLSARPSAAPLSSYRKVPRLGERVQEPTTTACDPGCVKTKSDLVVMASEGRILAFFALSVTTSLKILGAVIPR